jgi:hypothetical protein
MPFSGDLGIGLLVKKNAKSLRELVEVLEFGVSFVVAH